ncbi:hypothetical protein BJ322DRAFT_6842 [Thelephora terrestris]|uniref:Uncharacterized protein n=1 Tax=Thelephora terrestris TaxID=56493 RepID=A0A9P6LC21_9AGAM|nr:hypothetical protein BJ322DRAFT_6842 [Thelephora terrestris]
MVNLPRFTHIYFATYFLSVLTRNLSASAVWPIDLCFLSSSNLALKSPTILSILFVPRPIRCFVLVLNAAIHSLFTAMSMSTPLNLLDVDNFTIPVSGH